GSAARDRVGRRRRRPPGLRGPVGGRDPAGRAGTGPEGIGGRRRPGVFGRGDPASPAGRAGGPGQGRIGDPPGRGPGGPRRCPGRLLELRHPRGAPGPSRVARELNYTRVIAEEEAPTYPAEHMFERRVLGVDPGTAAVGLAVIDGERRPVIVWAQTLRTP